MRSKEENQMATIVGRNQGIFLKGKKAKNFLEEKPDRTAWEKIIKQSNKFRKKEK